MGHQETILKPTKSFYIAKIKHVRGISTFNLCLAPPKKSKNTTPRPQTNLATAPVKEREERGHSG